MSGAQAVYLLRPHNSPNEVGAKTPIFTGGETEPANASRIKELGNGELSLQKVLFQSIY